MGSAIDIEEVAAEVADRAFRSEFVELLESR